MNAVQRRTSPMLLRRRLGEELRRHREARGQKAGDVAKDLGINPSVLSRLENGQRRPVLLYVTALCDYYGLDHDTADALRRIAQGAHADGWWEQWNLDEEPTEFVGFEAGAKAVLTYEPGLVPGLLQTAEYARRIALSLKFGVTEEQIRRKVEFRINRQRILRGDDPLRLHAILHEAVLRVDFNDPGMRRRQLEYLLECSALPNVTLQVLRFNADSAVGLLGSFAVLEFADDLAKDVVQVETVLGSKFERKESEVDRCKDLFSEIESAADGEDASLAFIEALLRDSAEQRNVV
ncbi:helix-turn-helix transcriptional regulator [Actinoplanes sp. NPDC051851]|uniref:helix-turn-helix domain-containing protein n=1 Tax=Actinoplanes sp. NPDC051851 TaxID=3154753 RepID=UPI00343FCC48